MIAVVDLKISNLASVINALRLVGASEHVLATPENVPRTDAVILPGVGAFGDGMASLREQVTEMLRRRGLLRTPIQTLEAELELSALGRQFADEVMEVWDSAGRLVAQSSQLTALRIPADTLPPGARGGSRPPG